MLKYGNNVFSVTIDLPVGLYAYLNISATGKTWLKEKLLRYKTYGANVAVLDATHRDVCGSPELIVVDRYDAFPVDVSLLKEWAKSAVVLVDTKRGCIDGTLSAGVCIHKSSDGIRVCDL